MPEYRLPYEEYIKSSVWQARKTLYYSKHKKCCAACGSKEELQLHHATYVRIGEELDKDLVCLCQEHHQLVHQLHKAYSCEKTLAQVTSLVVAQIKKTHNRPLKSKKLKRRVKDKYKDPVTRAFHSVEK